MNGDKMNIEDKILKEVKSIKDLLQNILNRQRRQYIKKEELIKLLSEIK